MKVAPHHLIKGIHFIGIGGIGMSGIAEVVCNLGYKVSGSDMRINANTQNLQSLGVTIYQGHCPSHVDRAQVVVVSSAVPQDNEELMRARQLHIPVLHRADMLAELMQLKLSLAVAGTHGKTTTTSLGAALLDAAGLDPTVINGGIINAYKTNARLGAGKWMVVEADESDGSFTKLFPTIAIITNIDPDHMDHYKTEEALYQAFYQFITNLPFYGVGILCIDHPTVKTMATSITDRRIVTYGFHEEADVRGHHLRLTPNGSYFDVDSRDRTPNFTRAFGGISQSKVYQLPKRMKDVFLPMVGSHNVQNALSIIASAQELGLSEATIRHALSTFSGVKRRFTYAGTTHGVTIIDDYAHHPVEIKAVLQAARQVAGIGKVIAVAQPHRYTRVRDLMDDFSRCFDEADEIILCPIYGAGENPIPGITIETLQQKIITNQIAGSAKRPFIAEDPKSLISILAQISCPGDLVICMGAGTITHWAAQLPQELGNYFDANPPSNIRPKKIRGS